jgi:putative endonuclease
MYYVYYAKSLSNNKVYVGKTSKEPLLRIEEHNKGSNDWTKRNGPFKLIYYEEFCCQPDAAARERFYKSGIGRKIKAAIIRVMDL